LRELIEDGGVAGDERCARRTRCVLKRFIDASHESEHGNMACLLAGPDPGDRVTNQIVTPAEFSHQHQRFFLLGYGDEIVRLGDSVDPVAEFIEPGIQPVLGDKVV
jgi:hypothetical protein